LQSKPSTRGKGTFHVRLLHTPAKLHVRFDAENLLGAAGLVPLMALAERIGLPDLVDAHLRLPAEAGAAGAHAAAKVSTLLAGMAAGADCVDDMNLLRHGAYDAVFAGTRAPSTLGTFLRALGLGNVSQLAKILRLVLCRSVRAVPGVLTGLDSLAIVDLDSCQRRVYGPAKQGARFGHVKVASRSVSVRGLNALIGTITTPTSPPSSRTRGYARATRSP
jgi:hypothetical protein